MSDAVTGPTVGWAATTIAAAVRAGEVSAEQVVSEHLRAISEREGELHAWAHLDPDAAFRAAAAVDADPDAAGPLAGVPFGVKDIVDVAGMPTANGADVPVTAPAAADATAVARLRDAGAIPLGKTVTTEYALFRPGPTRNPHDPTRTPGGSSSGSAAAVGAGTLPLAIGTQTAGSVVRPASFCGTVGGKPTLGAVPRDGVTPCSTTLDTVGLLGREVADVALGLGVMADDLAAFAPTSWHDRLRLGVCRTFEWDEVEPSARAEFDRAVEGLAVHLDLVEVTVPEALRGLVTAQQAIMAIEAADALGPVRDRHGDLLSPTLHAVLEEGAARRWSYEAALALAQEARARLPELFADVDVLLAPAVRGEAPALDTTGDPLLCRQWTLLGTPTIAVPGLTGEAGLPLGVQTVASPGGDGIALGAAAVLAPLLAQATAGSADRVGN
jgi:Asp-tRNA(Asn)/Glu-tRNA(Gln) amidotransferase A subunit family amidase